MREISVVILLMHGASEVGVFCVWGHGLHGSPMGGVPGRCCSWWPYSKAMIPEHPSRWHLEGEIVKRRIIDASGIEVVDHR